MHNFISMLLDLIYKRKCYLCKSSKDNKFLCKKCYDSIIFNSKAEIAVISGCSVFCVTAYKDGVQKLIRALKYHQKKEAAYYLARLTADYFESLDLMKNFVVVPVPLHKERIKKRKYNQMVLIGEEFCNITGLEINIDLVSRVKNTKAQYRLNKKQRQENLKNAFEVDVENFDKNSEILLIDDIFTTGSTLGSVIKELKKHGINNITCLTCSVAG